MRSRLRLTRTVYPTVILALTIASATPTGPATAQGLFDFLFNPFRKPPAQPHSYVDPNARGFTTDRPARPSRRSDGTSSSRGGGASYCVRLCDGRYFPVQSRRDAAPAEICSALCPAADTKIFSGSSPEYAVAADGKSYKDLPSAFAYRTTVVSDCTCNGKDPFGLAQLDIEKDPTVQSGDIVATHQGLMVASRSKQQTSFSPLKGDMRSRMLAVKVAPNPARKAGDISIKTEKEKEPEVTSRVVRPLYRRTPDGAGETTTDGKRALGEP